MEQTTNYLPYILTGLVMMIVGWTMGFFDSNMRSSKKIKQAETSASAAMEEAKHKIAQAEAKLASVAANPVKVDDPGLLRIKSENGFLTLDMDGTRVDTNALSSEQRKRLIEMLTLVRPWLEGKPVHVPAPATTPPPLSQSNSAVEARPSAPIPSAPPPSQSLTQPPAATPRMTSPRPTTIAKEDRPAAPAGSIVSQIDSILQQRVVGTPLEDRGVFLAQSPEGGVIVYIGLTKYMGIDDVPDPEVKAAIRAAITEWENKYTPGL